MTAELTIRTLSLPQIETLVDWAGDEGWNPGLADATAFQAADPAGFLGAFAGGEMAAGISAVSYGSGFGFIGLYICRPDLRGRGYGKAVWDAGMARLSGRTIGLDAVPAQQVNYESMGFVSVYRTIRYSGHLSALASAGYADLVAESHVAAVSAFDQAYFPAPRQGFLKHWLTPPHTALMEHDGSRIVGYGVARRCREGAKVGPLFARNDKTALRLFAALAARCGGVVHIDVPETQRAFADHLTQSGFVAGFETARMYRGAVPAVDVAGVFGVTSLELG